MRSSGGQSWTKPTGKDCTTAWHSNGLKGKNMLTGLKISLAVAMLTFTSSHVLVRWLHHLFGEGFRIYEGDGKLIAVIAVCFGVAVMLSASWGWAQ